MPQKKTGITYDKADRLGRIPSYQRSADVGSSLSFH